MVIKVYRRLPSRTRTFVSPLLFTSKLTVAYRNRDGFAVCEQNSPLLSPIDARCSSVLVGTEMILLRGRWKRSILVE
jgi:hypothetical protein